jgi:hypothetical protein
LGWRQPVTGVALCFVGTQALADLQEQLGHAS